MQLAHGALVAVADGADFKLFRNSGDERDLKLEVLPHGEVDTENRGSGGRHYNSAANPSESQLEEDSFAAGTAEQLNRLAMKGGTEAILIIAAPRTLGELRKHYHKTLSARLVGEIDKDLTGHTTEGIEKAIVAA